MKTFLTTVLAPVLFLIFYADSEPFEPTILVLYPNEIIMPPDISEEVKIYVQEMEITDAIRKDFIKEGLPENWKLIRGKELEFIAKQDFGTLLTLNVTRDITYREVQYHDNLLIYPVKESSASDKNNYKSLAEKYNVSWVLNIPKVELSYDGTKKHMKATVQLYNVISGWIFLDASYTADDSNPTDTCEPGSWMCVIEDIKNHIGKAVMDKIERNRHRHHLK